MASMFTFEDVRQLLAHFPPKHSSGPEALRSAIAQPSLIQSISNDGLLRSDLILRNTQHALEVEPSKWVQTSVFAQKFGVNTNSLLELCEQLQGSVLLSRDKAAIASKRHRDDLKSELSRKAAGSIVCVEDFALAGHISASNILLLVNEFNKTMSWEDQLVVIADSEVNDRSERHYVCQRRFLTDVENHLLAQIAKAWEDAEPLMCNPMDFGGTRSISLLRILMQNSGVSAQGKLRGRLESRGSILMYEPESHLVKRHDLILDRLRNGDLPFVQFTQLTNNNGEPCNLADAVKYATDQLSDGSIICSDYLVSMVWLRKVADMKTNELLGNGYTALGLGEETSVLSKEAREALVLVVEEEIRTAFLQAAGHSQVESTRGYLITADLRHSFEAHATDQAQKQAHAQWSHPKTDSHQYTFFDTAPSDNGFLDPILAEILLQTGSGDRARAEFEKEIARLEDANEEQFSLFWRERIAVRFQLHETAVESLNADKLQSQLLELLRDHIVKELIPENLARARLKDLVKSKKTSQNIEKLKTALTAITRPGSSEDHSLKDLKLVLSKFMRKQNIEWFDAESLAGKKLAYVEDVVRSMQKENNGARLFLMLIIVLLSRTQEGVLYATGKFAPRLLKALKGALDPEQYQRLDQLKDAVKAGNVTREDIEAIRAMVA